MEDGTPEDINAISTSTEAVNKNIRLVNGLWGLEKI